MPTGVFIRYWHAAHVVSLPCTFICAVGAANKLTESTNFGVKISLNIRSCNSNGTEYSRHPANIYKHNKSKKL